MLEDGYELVVSMDGGEICSEDLLLCLTLFNSKEDRMLMAGTTEKHIKMSERQMPNELLSPI